MDHFRTVGNTGRDRAAGIQGDRPEHPGNNIQERGHGLPAAGGIQGQQVDTGRTDRRIVTGQCRQEIFFGRNDRRRQTQLRVIQGLRPGRKASGAPGEKSGKSLRQSVQQEVYSHC